MAILTLLLKIFTVSLFLFAASTNNFVDAAAVRKGGAKCGYGKRCADGYKCVKKNNNARTCQKISSPATPTFAAVSSSEYDSFPSAPGPSTSLARYASESAVKPEYTLTYVSQSYDINLPDSSGYVTKRSEHASASNSIQYYSSASQYTSKSSHEPPPTGHVRAHSNCTASCSAQPTGTGNPQSPQNPANNFTAVVGVPTKVVERRSIDVLQDDYPDVFNLLMLAFESIQEKDESDDLSYYQISGIHGFPFTPWQYPPRNPAPRLGYCTHASSIFTTWHRPYVLLLEQILYEEAMAIAKRFTGPDASKYLAAAEEVRLPYWDWASDKTSRLPKAAVEPSIAVVKPGSASPTTIPNPLYTYNRRDTGRATVRAATAEADLVDTFAERQSLTSALFTDTSYDDFSFNLEDIHNLVHVLVGGDMVDVARAAFDPLFWLHHCNVDRLMAMYQATHPNLYLSPARRTPTYALSGPGTDDLSTPLYPFRHPNAREWTSDDVKTAESIFEYGYAYPEVPQGRSGDDLKAFTTQKVNELYGPSTEDSSFQGEESGVPDLQTARREWNANIVVDSNEIPGSQQIRLFIGDSGKNDSNSFSRDDLAGVAGVFSSSLAPGALPSRLLNITVPLTQALVDKNVGLRPEDVVPKLANDLHWAVEQVGDTKTSIPVQDLKSLQISVSSQITDYPEDKTKLPVKSESETFFAPTNDKAGGLQTGEAPPVGRPAANQTTGNL